MCEPPIHLPVDNFWCRSVLNSGTEYFPGVDLDKSALHNTGFCLLSQEKAVKDVKSCVRFCFLVGVILDFDLSIFSCPIQIEDNPDYKTKPNITL